MENRKNRNEASREGGWSLLVRVELDGIGDRPCSRLKEEFLGSLEELAEATLRLGLYEAGDPGTRWREAGRGSWEAGGSGVRLRGVALSPKGKPLRLDWLASMAIRRREEFWAERRAKRLGWRGDGPVPGTGRGRGYVRWRANSGRSHGAGNFLKERSWVEEEGEVEGRKSLSGKETRNRFDAWEDPWWRRTQKCWKEQRKGRKSWDRGAGS